MIIMFMLEKVKVRCNSMQKNIFKSYRKFKVYFLLSKSVFALHNLRWNDGTSRCTAKVCVIRPSQAELFNLIQVFPLLQLAPATFFPALPYPHQFHLQCAHVCHLKSCSSLVQVFMSLINIPYVATALLRLAMH